MDVDLERVTCHCVALLRRWVLCLSGRLRQLPCRDVLLLLLTEVIVAIVSVGCELERTDVLVVATWRLVENEDL